MSHELQEGVGHHPKKEPDRLQKPQDERKDKGAPHPEPTWKREGHKSPNAKDRDERATIQDE